MSKIEINDVGLDWMAQQIMEILADRLEYEANTRELQEEISTDKKEIFDIGSTSLRRPDVWKLDTKTMVATIHPK